MRLRIIFIAIVALVSSLAFGQVTIMSENMGSPAGTTSIAANIFQNSGTLSYMGNGDVRITTVSSGYTGASGNGNVLITNTIGTFFQIAGINTSSYTSLSLSVGHYKTTNASSNELAIEVSADGTTYTPLTYSRPTGSGTSTWMLINPTGAIPSTSNLRIRFRQTSTGPQFRIDDVVLTGINSGPYTISGGDWNTAAIWNTNSVPLDTDNVTITAGHVVYTNASLTRTGATLVNGTFQLDAGGYATGTNFTYGAAGSLNFNNTSSYGVANSDVFWPAAGGPVNVSVLQGGLTMNSANRTVSGIFSTKAGVTLNSSALTIGAAGTCRIDAGGFFANVSPTYTTGSLLLYNTNSLYNRQLEWTGNAASAGVGTPYNVQLSNNTTLNYINGSNSGAKAVANNLTIDAGSALYMDYGNVSSAGALSVGGNLTNNGNFTMGFAPGDDLKLASNFTNTGTFNGNNRAVYFTKSSGVQTVSSSSALTIPYIVFDSAGNRTVQLTAGTNLTVSAPLAGNAISFGSASDIFDINGNTLTIGTAGVANVISGAGTFKGSATSNLALLGMGSVGTLNFTAGFQNLGTLIMNRSAAATGCIMGTPLTLNTSLVLTAGHIDLGSTTMTFTSGVAANTAGSANSFVIADDASGGILKRNITAINIDYVFPVGDKTGSIEYSPATVKFTSGSFTLAYFGISVNDSKELNMDANTDFLSRYWAVASSGSFGTIGYTFTGTYLAADVNGTEGNSQSNQWNGASWTNFGAPVGVAGGYPLNTLVIPATTLPATNHFTAGRRNADINIKETATGTLYANNSTYNFNTQLTGSTTDITFTIQNLGQQSLTFSSATVTGATYSFNPAFALTSISGPSGSRTFTIRFAPVSAGTFTGNVTFATNDPDENPYVINFTGAAIVPVPEIKVESVSLNSDIPNNSIASTGFDTKFATQVVGSTSAAKTYRIKNLGTANLTISSIGFDAASANPGDFILTATPSAIAPGASITFTIKFSPIAPGLRSAIIVIGNDDSDESPYYFNIEGTGQGPEINLSSSGVTIASGSLTPSAANNTDFGDVNITTGSVTRIFTISNIGDASLTVSSITKSGTGAADFTISSTATPFTIANNASAVVSITFDPTTIGVKDALITIANSDGDEPVYTFAIQGNAVNYIPCALSVIQTIGQQDFEAAPVTPVLLYNTTQDAGAGAIFVGGGQAKGETRTTDTNKFIGASSFQIAGNAAGTAKSTTIDFATVDASTYSEVSLNFQLGAYASTSTQGVDTADKVVVYVSTNGGTTWSSEMDISGRSNAIWDINTSTGSATANYDGNNIPFVFQAPNGSLNLGPKNISLSDLPNSAQLKVRIVFTIDRNDEIFVIDNVKLEGKRPAVSTWASGAWTPSAPTASVKAIINSPYNTSLGNVDACSCQNNATVTVNANQYFDIQSTIENNGTIIVDNNGSLIQNNDAAVNLGTGTYTIKRTTSSYNRYDYTYWSSPVSNATLGGTFPLWRTDYEFQFVAANYADVAAPFDGFDDDGNAWQFVATSTVMTPGKGYAVMAPSTGTFPATSTVSFSGPVNNGTINIPMTMSANAASSTDDFNLIGNPYPSAIYANDFINANPAISGTLYFWTHRTGISNSNPGPDANNFITADYAMYNLTGGTSSGTGSPVPTGYVASGEGFFVDTNSATNAVFNNSMRNKAYSNSLFYRTSAPAATEESVRNRLWINLQNTDGLFSQQLLGYFDNTTLGYDRAYDGIVSKTSNTLSFYSFIDGDKYRIQARPSFAQNDVVPLGYSSTMAGTFSIAIGNKEGQFDDAETNIFIEDKLLGIIHDLKQSAYSFTTAAGTFDTRFVLRYLDSSLGTVDFEDMQKTVVVATSGSQIMVKSPLEDIQEVTVYDILGRQVYAKNNVNNSQLTITDAVLNQQALIVKVRLENGMVVNRKIVF